MRLQGAEAMTTRLSGAKRAWLVVAMLWPVAFINYIDRTMLTTMHESLVTSIHMTEAQFGLLTSVFLWVYGVMIPAAGYLSDRFNRRWVVIGSLLGWSLTTFLTACANTFPQLLAARVCLGLSECCCVPAAMALITDYHPGSTRSFALGVYQTGMMAGMMFGGIGGWLSEQYSWRLAFILTSLPGMAYGLLLIFTLRDKPGQSGRNQQTGEMAAPIRFGTALRTLLGNPAFVLEMAVVVVLGAAGWIIIGWLPTFMAERFGMAQGESGFLATAYLNGATGVGLIAGGLWTARWNRTNPRSPIYVSIAGLAVAIPAMLMAANAGDFHMALIWLVLFGITRTFCDVNIVPILCLVADVRYRGTAIGVISTCTSFTGGVMIYFVGALRDIHMDLGRIFAIAAGSMILCVGLLLLIKFKPEQCPIPIAD